MIPCQSQKRLKNELGYRKEYPTSPQFLIPKILVELLLRPCSQSRQKATGVQHQLCYFHEYLEEKNTAEIKPIKRLNIVIMLGLSGVCKNNLVSWREKNRVMVLSIKLSLLSPLLCKRFLC